MITTFFAKNKVQKFLLIDKDLKVIAGFPGTALESKILVNRWCFFFQRTPPKKSAPTGHYKKSPKKSATAAGHYQPFENKSLTTRLYCPTTRLALLPDYPILLPDFTTRLPDFTTRLPDLRHCPTTRFYCPTLLPDCPTIWLYYPTCKSGSKVGQSVTARLPDFTARLYYPTTRFYCPTLLPDYSILLPDFTTRLPDFTTRLPDFTTRLQQFFQPMLFRLKALRFVDWPYAFIFPTISTAHKSECIQGRMSYRWICTAFKVSLPVQFALPCRE